MNKKVLCLFFFTIILKNLIFSYQYRITTHKIYFPVTTDTKGAIYFLKHESGKNLDLFKMNESGTDIKQLTNDNLQKVRFGSDFSKFLNLFDNDKKIVLIKFSKDYDYIYTMNNDGTSATEIYHTTDTILSITISPDKQKIAFVKQDNTNGTLCLINSNGTNLKIFSDTINLVKTEENIFFSSDSAKVFFVNITGKLSKINIDGTGYEEIQPVTKPQWLSKSNEIIFIDEKSGQHILAKVLLDGSNYTSIYSTTSKFSNYSISPDETKFALIVDTNLFEHKLVIVSKDGVVLKEISLSSILPLSFFGWYFLKPTILWISNEKLLISNYKNIYTINSDGGNFKNITDNISPNTFLTSLWLDAKADKVAFYEIFEDVLYVKNINNLKTTLKISFSENQIFGESIISLSPDGEKIIYTVGEIEGNDFINKLYLRNTDNSGTTILISTGNIWPVYWSPESKKILFRRTNKYYIYEISNNLKMQIPYDADNFVFSPDSTKVVFWSNNIDGKSGIFCAPIDFSTYSVILSTTSNAKPLDWKSNKILFFTSEFSSYYLYVIDSDGKNLKYLDETNFHYYDKSKLSPNGTKVAYVDNNFTGLYVINADGANKTKILDLEEEKEVNFGWCLDSTKLVYSYRISPRNIDLYYFYLADVNTLYKNNLNSDFIFSFLSLPVVYPITNNKIVYYTELDIWAGDYDPTVSILPPDISLPKEEGEIKIVIPEGVGLKGTINPNSQQPISIGFKGKGPGKFTLRIFTLLGEQVYEETKETTDSQGYFEWIPLRNLATGVYIVYIEGPGIKNYKKIAILR